MHCRRMVRLIAAGLVEVGQGRLSAAQFKKLLDVGDRALLKVEAAPPHGLCLEEVRCPYCWHSHGQAAVDHTVGSSGSHSTYHGP